MVQALIPKALRPMKFYFTTVYQEIWVGVALTSYAYYKISYGGKLHIIVFFIEENTHHRNQSLKIASKWEINILP